MQHRKEASGFVDLRALCDKRAPQSRSRPLAFRDDERDRFERCQRVEQLRDLKSAHQSTARSLMRRQRRDVFAFEVDAAARRGQHAGQQIDERGLAGAVGSDQRMPCAAGELERNVLRRGNSAEVLVQRMRRQDDVAHRRATTRCRSFATRSRPASISATRTRPIQNCQYCGVHVEKRSCISLNATVPTMPP